jgi:hypothetical protein
VGGRRGERGAATLETTGVFVVAAILVLALLVAIVPQAPVLGQTFEYWICKVTTLGQGSCGGTTSADDHRPTEPCVVDANSVASDMKVSVVFFTTNEGKRVEVAKLNDGRYRVTVTDGGGAGVETGVGGGLSVTVNDRTVGGTASAGAGASLQFKAGDVYYASDEAGLQDIIDAVQQDQIKDATVGDSGPVRWLTDRVTDVTGTTADFPDADEVYAEGGISLNASAEATALTDSAKAGLTTATMLGVKTTKDGKKTVYLKSTVEGEAGLQSLGIDTSGPQFEGAKLEGKLEVVNAVTFDSNGNMVSVQATATAAGTSSGVASAMFGGDSDSALSNQVSNARVWQATLPITNSTDALVAGQYLLASGTSQIGAWVNPAVAAAGLTATPYTAAEFFAAARDRGITTQQDFSTNNNTVFGVDASGKLGVELGVSASVKTESLSATGAQYWDGQQWQTWQGCGS